MSTDHGQGIWGGGDPEQLPNEDTLVQDDVSDELDRGFSLPDRPRPGGPWDDDHASEEHETLDERLAEEEPETGPEQVADQDGDQDRDPDEIDASQDWLGDPEVGDERAGRLVSPDQGAGEDEEAASVGSDVGIDGAASTAEEAAVHVVPEQES